MSAHHHPSQGYLENIRKSVIGGETSVTLVVGQVSRWMSEGKALPDVRDLTYIDYDDLNRDVLEQIQPDVVLAPLVTDAFDAIQIVRYLDSFGYRGRFRAIAPSLPNIAMVKNEIKKAAPDIDSDIVVMQPNVSSVN